MERKSRAKESKSRRRNLKHPQHRADIDPHTKPSSRMSNTQPQSSRANKRSSGKVQTVNNTLIVNNYIKFDSTRKKTKRKMVFSSSQLNRFENSSEDSSEPNQNDLETKTQPSGQLIPRILKNIHDMNQRDRNKGKTNITINNIQIHRMTDKSGKQTTALGKRSKSQAGLSPGEYRIKKKNRRDREKAVKAKSKNRSKVKSKSRSRSGKTKDLRKSSEKRLSEGEVGSVDSHLISSGKHRRRRKAKEKRRRRDKDKSKKREKEKRKKSSRRKRSKERKSHSSRRNSHSSKTDQPMKIEKSKTNDSQFLKKFKSQKTENITLQNNPSKTAKVRQTQKTSSSPRSPPPMARKDSKKLIFEALHNESENSEESSHEIEEEKPEAKAPAIRKVTRSRVITRRRAREISSQENLENERANAKSQDVSGLGEMAEGTERDRIKMEKNQKSEAVKKEIEEEQTEVKNEEIRVEILPKKQTNSKKSKVVLNTAHKVLKKHLEKIKSNLIIQFNEKLQTKFKTKEKPNIETKNGLSIISKPSKIGELVLIFHPIVQPEISIKIETPNPTSESRKSRNLENPPKKGRSARMNSKLNLIEQIDQQDKLEKIEITFLSSIEKIFENLGLKAERGMYVFFSDYLKDLKKALRKISQKFPKLRRPDIIRILAANLDTVRKKFQNEKLNEIKKLSDHLIQFKINSSTYPRVHLQNRVYKEVNEYTVNKSVLRSLKKCRDELKAKEKYSTHRLMRSEIKPSCKGRECDCCRKPLEMFCEFKPNQSNWISNCDDKKEKIECDESCGCGPNCNNSFLRKGEMQILGKDVSLRQCWGVDFYSRKNLFHLLPRHLTIHQKGLIIDNALRELNLQGHNGWNVKYAVEKTYKAILTRLNEVKPALNSKKSDLNIPTEGACDRVGGDLYDFLYAPRNDWGLYVKEIEKLSQSTEVLLKQMRIKQLRECIKSFSKGLGVVCTKRTGIERNSLIVKYFGEVYPPWYWYLKQDAIKSFLTQLKKGKFKKLSEYRNDYNMEFYNIFLEKHRKEPGGTELLIVDPIMRGNYASRLSHACVPNCVTLPVVSSGQYAIGLYSQKKVRFGDELTFDYCSFTESEKEYQNSVCLCGSSHCRGYYLSCNRKHFHVFSQARSVLLDNSDKCFLVWNMILLKSCVSKFDNFKEERLKRFSIGENIFKNSPEWLKTWAFFVMEQILKERAGLYNFYFQKSRDEVLQMVLTDLKPLERNWRYEVENLFEQRLQNLIISLDKALNFLDRQKEELDQFEPLQLSSLKTSLRTTKSLLSTIVNFSQLNDEQLETKIKTFLEKEILPAEDEKNIPAQIDNPKLRALVRAKYLVFLLSDYFTRNAGAHDYHPAIADVLYFHSMTKMTFSMNSFSGFEIEIHVRDCDLTNPLKLLKPTNLSEIDQQYKTNQIIYTMKKKIAASYLWGQLVFWNKQTIEKPEASLSAGRRGTLTFPEVTQSFLSPNRKHWEKYPWGSRKNWLESIRDKPGDYWPIGDGWSYENKEKVYGTFLSDDFFMGTNNRFRIIENIDNSIPFKFGVFINIWKNFHQ